MHNHSEWLPLLCSIFYTFRHQVFPPSVVEKYSKRFNYWDAAGVINKLVPLWYTAALMHTKIKQKGKWDLNASTTTNAHLLKYSICRCVFSTFLYLMIGEKPRVLVHSIFHTGSVTWRVHFTAKHCAFNPVWWEIESHHAIVK